MQTLHSYIDQREGSHSAPSRTAPLQFHVSSMENSNYGGLRFFSVDSKATYAAHRRLGTVPGRD